MTIATIDQLKDQLSFTDDLGSGDDTLLTRLLDAAQDHVERHLGILIEETYGGVGQDPVPPSLVQAVLLLAAHWYEHREGASEGAVREIPFGVREIITEYREFTF